MISAETYTYSHVQGRGKERGSIMDENENREFTPENNEQITENAPVAEEQDNSSYTEPAFNGTEETGEIETLDGDGMVNGKRSNAVKYIIAACLVIAAIAIVVIVLLVKNKDGEEPVSEDDSFHKATTDLTGLGKAEKEDLPVEIEDETGEDDPALTPAAANLNIEIGLGEYKGITVATNPAPVTDEDIANEMTYFLSSYAEEIEITDRTDVQNGDITDINFVGYMDGVAFEGGTADNYTLVIGSHSFIDGFEDGLIGVNVGETVTLHLNFPDPYPKNPDLAGKPVDFEVTVNSITESKVPELTDELIAEKTQYQTIAEYTEAVRSGLEAQNSQTALTEAQTAVLDELITRCTYGGDIDAAISYRIQEMSDYYESFAYYYAGCDAATFFAQLNGMSKEDYENFLVDNGTKQAKLKYVLLEIAKVENITVSEEEYNEQLSGYIADYGLETEEQLYEYVDRSLIEEEIIYNKAYDFVLENAVIN